MKKITIMTAILVMLAGTAFAKDYICTCKGNNYQKLCGCLSAGKCEKGYAGGNFGRERDVTEGKLKRYLPDDVVAKMKTSYETGYSSISGWSCTPKELHKQ